MNHDASKPSLESPTLLDTLKDKPVIDTRSGWRGVLVDVVDGMAVATMPSTLEWRTPIDRIRVITDPPRE